MRPVGPLPRNREGCSVEAVDYLARDAGMITVGLIRNGATYRSQHLRKNDYWSEGEKEARGEWSGKGARALGVTAPVTDKRFEPLRQNRHPGTGEALTARVRPTGSRSSMCTSPHRRTRVCWRW